jgi:hypothetical protein
VMADHFDGHKSAFLPTLGYGPQSSQRRSRSARKLYTHIYHLSQGPVRDFDKYVILSKHEMVPALSGLRHSCLGCDLIHTEL